MANDSAETTKGILGVLNEAGINLARVTSVDTSKIDDALEVTDVSEQAVCAIDESE